MTDGTVLMTAEEIDRALSRIAHQVLDKTGGPRDLAFVGIHTRGVPLARRIAWKIAQAGEDAPPVGILDINLYRDDLTHVDETPIVRRTELPFKIAERQIVLVDDVLFTGRTIRAAMDALSDLGRPRVIRLACLIDRGGRELPIQPDFCGRTFTVHSDQLVEVRLAEMDGGPDGVTLRSKAAALAARAQKEAAAREAGAALRRETFGELRSRARAAIGGAPAAALAPARAGKGRAARTAGRAEPAGGKKGAGKAAAKKGKKKNRKATSTARRKGARKGDGR